MFQLSFSSILFSGLKKWRYNFRCFVGRNLQRNLAKKYLKQVFSDILNNIVCKRKHLKISHVFFFKLYEDKQKKTFQQSIEKKFDAKNCENKIVQMAPAGRSFRGLKHPMRFIHCLCLSVCRVLYLCSSKTSCKTFYMSVFVMLSVQCHCNLVSFFFSSLELA